MANKRYYSSINSSRTYQGADKASENNPVIAKIRPEWRAQNSKDSKKKTDIQFFVRKQQKREFLQLNENVSNTDRAIFVTGKHREHVDWNSGYFTVDILQDMDKRREVSGKNDT